MRILIVADEPGMHDSYRRCFAPAGAGDGAALDAMAAELFDDAPTPGEEPIEYALTHALQGLDGVSAVERALADGQPYAVAFIAVRMPPGIDGKETAMRIRALDPDINLVMVTGFSDFSPIEISKAAGPADKIFYIAKPFEVAEVTQMAAALVHRWQVDRQLAEARAALAAQIVQLEQQGAELAANESQAMHIATHDSPRGPRAQRRQAERPRHQTRIRRKHGRSDPPPPPHRGRPVAGDRPRRVEPGLSADRRTRRTGGGRFRGAGALEHRGIRSRQPGLVHPDRQGIEPAPPPRR